MVLQVAGVSQKYSLEINALKTKWIIVPKKRGAQSIELSHLNRQGRRVDKFLHLRKWFQEEMNQSMERELVKQRAHLQEWEIFSQGRIWIWAYKWDCSSITSCPYCCIAWKAGCCHWDLKKRIRALEMFIYYHLLKISWRDEVTDEKVLRHYVQKTRTIKHRQRAQAAISQTHP